MMIKTGSPLSSDNWNEEAAQEEVAVAQAAEVVMEIATATDATTMGAPQTLQS